MFTERTPIVTTENVPPQAVNVVVCDRFQTLRGGRVSLCSESSLLGFRFPAGRFLFGFSA